MHRRWFKADDSLPISSWQQSIPQLALRSISVTPCWSQEADTMRLFATQQAISPFVAISSCGMVMVRKSVAISASLTLLLNPQQPFRQHWWICSMQVIRTLSVSAYLEYRRIKWMRQWAVVRLPRKAKENTLQLHQKLVKMSSSP